jgi:hypothetical protein
VFLLSAIADIESFWWLCVWCVMYFCVDDNHHCPTENHLRILTQLFPVPLNHYARKDILERFIGVADVPELKALTVLNEWRKVLWHLYQQAEGTRTTVNDDVTKDVVKHISSFVADLYWNSNDVPVEIVPSLMQA